MATHSWEMATQLPLLAWEIPWTGGAWQAIVHGGHKKVRHNLATEHKNSNSFHNTTVLLRVTKENIWPGKPEIFTI